MWAIATTPEDDIFVDPKAPPEGEDDPNAGIDADLDGMGADGAGEGAMESRGFEGQAGEEDVASIS